MKRPVQNARGAILIMAAIIMVVLIGVAALALDLGRLFVLHTEMQNAVDAAVLSAAAELDGEDNAQERAMAAANQEMLNHLSHFGNKAELLENLQNKEGLFTFYSWIGSNVDSPVPPSTCTPVDGKCEIDDPSDNSVSYVKITLDPDPALFGTDDGRYEIDLYFLPVLSLFSIETATTASTKVEALAGSHYEFCNYPPIFICDPIEADPPRTLNRGEQVILRQATGGGTIVAGGFGWLMPGYSEADPHDNDLGLNSPRLFIRRLGSKYPLDCGSPIVEINTGNTVGDTRLALNTRFGLYPSNFTNWYYKEDFPSAPNILDYPRDSNLTEPNNQDTCVLIDCPTGNPECRIGDGDWGDDEILCTDQPSTFSRSTFITNYDGSGNATGTRAEHYDSDLAGTAAYSGSGSSEPQCNSEGRPNNPPCRILDADPTVLVTQPPFIDIDDSDKRRELFVAVVACTAHDIGANNPLIDLAWPDTRWMRFFLTEHVGYASAGADVYAEFIEEVTEREDEHFKKVIQLYE